MPLTVFQRGIGCRLAQGRSPDSHLAGGAAIHLEPNTLRFSNDLDYFHDSEERVATAFNNDRELLREGGYGVEVDLAQPGYIRARVSRGGEATKVEWSHDSAWRFLPAVRHEDMGYVLHKVDLAINKVLALAGRDEARDLVDVIELHQTVLPLGAMCWAAAGKDPGLSPTSLLELLRRRGKPRPEDIARLHLARHLELGALKAAWLEALGSAEDFVGSRPPDEVGCLYWNPNQERFVQPAEGEEVLPHYGRPGGVLPRIKE